MLVIKSAIATWVCSKWHLLPETCKSQNRPQVEYCAFFGDRTVVPISWTCTKQTDVSNSSTDGCIISLDAGLRMEELPSRKLWEVVDAFLAADTKGQLRQRSLSFRATNITFSHTCSFY